MCYVKGHVGKRARVYQLGQIRQDHTPVEQARARPAATGDRRMNGGDRRPANERVTDKSNGGIIH